MVLQVGGNRKAKEFLSSQPDWNPKEPISQRYQSRAAALYKDKILTESQGQTWSESTSSAKNHRAKKPSTNNSGMSSSQSCSNFSSNGSNGGIPDFKSDSFKAQKEDFFARKQNENASRPE